jgi:hypothetical protein
MKTDSEAEPAAAEWVAIASLTPWADNPRRNDGEPVARVAASIKRFGFANPVLARRENREVVAGHTRLKAAAALISEYASATKAARAEWHQEAVRVATRREVPVRFGDWSEREAHLLALADNRLAEFSEWDNESLHKTLGQFDLGEAELAGWSASEVDALASQLSESPQEVEVREIDTSDLTDTFSLVVTGRVRDQADVLERVASSLRDIEGVEVDLRYENR